MSRNVGQVTTREAATGALVIALVVVTIVAMANALVLRPEHVPAIDRPAVPETGRACPTPRESLPRHRVSPPATTDAVPVTSQALIECPSAFDGRSVTFEGEVVRAVLRRGSRAWVQLNDDPYALQIGPLPTHRATVGTNSGMAVSIPAVDAGLITHVGSARARGDRLHVTGTFLRADPADVGGPAIQAHTVVITAVGEPIGSPVTPARIVVALLFVTAAATMSSVVGRSKSR